MEDDALAFEVRGWDGEFTAFPADPYPSGTTSVYGPDDFELELSGSVLEIVSGVLSKLGGTRILPTPALIPFQSSDEPDDYFCRDREPSPSLKRELEVVRRYLGEDSVSATDIASSWRVRICLPTCQGQSGIDSTCAAAWGLDVARPLHLELHIPYDWDPSSSPLPPSAVSEVWQEEFPSFALNKQLLQVLRDFCLVASGQVLPSKLADLQARLGSSSMGYGIQQADDPAASLLLKYEKKKQQLLQKALSFGEGFLASLAIYLQLRVPTVHEYCAICDQPFEVAPMLMRTVCSSGLCSYQFSEFGNKITTADGINTQAEVVDLLVCMLMRAVKSSRRNLILDPYPTVYLQQGQEVLHPRNKDYLKLEGFTDELRALRSTVSTQLGAAWSVLNDRMSPEAAALVKWVVASNRSFLAPLDDGDRIAAFRTPFQYLLISAPPEKEQAFQELKEKHGSKFAFHGSAAENWHSILRNGLKNASNTALMTTGAAYGPGIYLSTHSSMSMGYATRQTPPSWGAAPPAPSELKRQKTGNRFVENMESLVMMAVCEVIDDSSNMKKNGNIWVVHQESMVITRFFLVFTEAMHQSVNVRILDLEQEIRALVTKNQQTRSARADE
eukprot:TRINITY_DN67936_c0_g1_i1.p1 TRINITY_DN67936_c0_g1~~TRINITY_DN67936_c0_g1_i1.p1  ORF type:complete len:657 (+),score=149.84 TRINITY_DN67936_c0_g1_i1:130-1971(+)